MSVVRKLRSLNKRFLFPKFSMRKLILISEVSLSHQVKKSLLEYRPRKRRKKLLSRSSRLRKSADWRRSQMLKVRSRHATMIMYREKSTSQLA